MQTWPNVEFAKQAHGPAHQPRLWIDLAINLKQIEICDRESCHQLLLGPKLANSLTSAHPISQPT
jgi:hypothetical protein